MIWNLCGAPGTLHLSGAAELNELSSLCIAVGSGAAIYGRIPTALTSSAKLFEILLTTLESPDSL